MMHVDTLMKIFKSQNMDFFTGVPDSTFSDWMKYLDDHHAKTLTNIIACNECEAVANAIGYYLATQKLAVVYMQNSGEGKAVNPLSSLCHQDVYGIPLMMMVGWRGAPGEKDEPQHAKMGKMTIELLDLLDVPYEIASSNQTELSQQIDRLSHLALSEQKPVALVVRKKWLSPYQSTKQFIPQSDITREVLIQFMVEHIDENDAVVSTTGKASRELFELRVGRDERPRDFYTVGGMGCAASIANSISLNKKSNRVFALDGDGASLMQMGAFATIGHYGSDNFYHILVDNGVHDSTGGQPTISNSVNFEAVALACGYRYAVTVGSLKELSSVFSDFLQVIGPALLIVKTAPGARADLGRPTLTPQENKQNFVKFLSGDLLDN